MDIFVEKMVRKQLSALDIFVKVSSFILALFIIVTAYIFLSSTDLSFLLPIITIGAGYGAWWLINSVNMEFEYAFTSGDLDVDKIISKKTRQRLITIDCKRATSLEKFKSCEQVKDKNATITIYANSGKSDDETYVLTAQHEKGSICLVFEPNEKMLAGIRSINRTIG